MKIYGMEKLSLVDYDGCTACTLFTGGCNFRCPFCHNSPLVVDAVKQIEIPQEEIFDYLSKRTKLLDGVVVSGGEPTLHKDLPEFIAKIKQLGYKVKLDTNGTNPKMLKKLIADKLIDYVAMDVKNSQEKYPITSGIGNLDIKDVVKSVEILKSDVIPYEFRTTLVNELHDVYDIEDIALWLAGAEKYVLQQFNDRGSNIVSGLTAVPVEAAQQYAEILRKKIKTVQLRY